MHILEAKGITFSYEDKPTRHVLKDMSFGIDKGTMTVLLGLSGSGKSTLCQILCGIIPGCIKGDLGGQIIFDGIDISLVKVSQLATKIGYVMQDPDRQMITTTVEDELAFGLENLCFSSEEIKERIEEIMNLLNLNHLRLQNPGMLSGGEKQVVAIGAILALNPDVIIMDEPLSHLDELGRQTVCITLRQLRDRGKTLLIVEQDYELLDFADRWVVLKDGVIQSQGDPIQMRWEEDLL